MQSSRNCNGDYFLLLFLLTMKVSNLEQQHVVVLVLCQKRNQTDFN